MLIRFFLVSKFVLTTSKTIMSFLDKNGFLSTSHIIKKLRNPEAKSSFSDRFLKNFGTFFHFSASRICYYTCISAIFWFFSKIFCKKWFFGMRICYYTSSRCDFPNGGNKVTLTKCFYRSIFRPWGPYGPHKPPSHQMLL